MTAQPRNMIDRALNRPGPRAFENRSYAQCGEDLILDFLLRVLLRRRQIRYLDIGAHDPYRFSNTYLFYRRGCRGVLVEPDPDLARRIRRARPEDVVLNVGVGTDAAESAPFYLMSEATLNTFSVEEAQQYDRTGPYRIREVVQLPLISVAGLLEEHGDPCPDLVSIDVEGWDQAILEAFDFDRWRPAAFCVETLTHDDDGCEVRQQPILDLMADRGYRVYADTYINTIFVDAAAFAAGRT